MNIGFIGLGIMGEPMAQHLVTHGHSLHVHVRRQVPTSLEGRVTVWRSATEVAQAADIVILMLPDTPDVESVLFGANGLAEGLSAGKTVIDMSSVSPIETRSFAERLAAVGVDFVDAPVSGGQVGARAASLTIMVGGSTAAVERVWPLLALMGKNITHVGPAGAGQITKVANQIIVALNIAAVAEALVFASKAGADPVKVREALLGGFASSKVLEVHGERMIQRTFAPGFRIELHQKDLGLALAGAKRLGMALPQTAGVAQLMQTSAAQGDAALDHSALVRAIELMASHELGAEQSK